MSLEKGMMDSVYLLKSHPEFEYIRVLGEGGFGQVLEMLDKKIGKRVAVKVVMRPSPGEEIYWPHLNDRNVVSLYRTVSLGERTAFVMPLMKRDMHDHIYDSDFINDVNSFIRKRKYAFNILSGLAYLHGRNLAHMDLKECNIMIHLTSDRALLTDFTFLTAIESVDKYTFAVPFSYLPPEAISTQWQGPVHGVSPEMWTFGITCLQIFTRHAYSSILDVTSKQPTFDDDMFPILSGMFVSKIMHLMLAKLHPSASVTLETAELFVEFLRKFLCMDPAMRIGAEEGLKHRFLNISEDMHGLEDEDGSEKDNVVVAESGPPREKECSRENKLRKRLAGTCLRARMWLSKKRRLFSTRVRRVFCCLQPEHS